MFVKNSANLLPIVDGVFSVVKKAQEAIKTVGRDQVVDATLGSLFNEENQLVALDSVFQSYDALPSVVKAKYAGSFQGNENYRKQVQQWVLRGYGANLASSVIATPGGSGALSASFDTLLDAKETIILPNIGWTSYQLMAQEKQLHVQYYEMFAQDAFHIASFEQVCRNVMKQQGKVVVVINDPCHNPTGYSMSVEEWRSVVSFLNELSRQGECVIVNDVAYIDYSYRKELSREYMQVFTDISDRLLVILAFSCSKSLTSYGLRAGAAIVLGKQEAAVRQVEIVMEKLARSIWSNVANAAMENFVLVTTQYKEAYEAEKQIYIALLQERSNIFCAEAKQADLPLYPYEEGFFVTVKVEAALLEAYHSLLMEHHIYTVKVDHGIRVAICGLNKVKCRGLASRMKVLLDQVQQ